MHMLGPKGPGTKETIPKLLRVCRCVFTFVRAGTSSPCAVAGAQNNSNVWTTVYNEMHLQYVSTLLIIIM